MAFGTEKRPDFGEYSSSSQSYFGKTMRIEGEITSDEDLTIEGKVKGQLEVSKTLTIGKEGYVEGKISASVIHISGEAEGHLTASKKLEISSEGKYTGNIKSDTIRVAEGAKIKGTINLDEETPTKPKSKEKKVEKEARPMVTMDLPQEKKEEPKEQPQQTQTKPSEKKEKTAASK